MLFRSLITYPVAGWLGAKAGLPVAFLALGTLAAGGVLVAMRVWPSKEPEAIEHTHDDLASTDPHLADAVPVEARFRHSHPFVIDSHHPEWPRSA